MEKEDFNLIQTKYNDITRAEYNLEKLQEHKESLINSKNEKSTWYLHVSSESSHFMSGVPLPVELNINLSEAAIPIIDKLIEEAQQKVNEAEKLFEMLKI